MPRQIHLSPPVSEIHARLYQLSAISRQGENSSVVGSVRVNVEQAASAALNRITSSIDPSSISALREIRYEYECHLTVQPRVGPPGVTVEEMSEYGYAAEVREGYDEAVIRARLALRGEGFSILTEMHVGGMLGPESGEERQYLIMGIYNPIVDQRDIGDDLRMATHLPCNVVIQEIGTKAIVAAQDPVDVIESDDPGTRELAAAARDALNRVLLKVSAS
jgi:uncharacterized protein (DUF302 family)